MTWIIIAAALSLMWLLRGPKCPVCGCRSWDKNYWGKYAWRCRWCGTWYDHLERHWKRD